MCDYLFDGAATAFDIGVAGVGTLLFSEMIFAAVGAVFCGNVAVVIGDGADLGFPEPEFPVDTVLTVSFSGQNKIARIASTSNTITIVGQCAFVNDQKDEACAVCGAAFVVGAG